MPSILSLYIGLFVLLVSPLALLLMVLLVGLFVLLALLVNLVMHLAFLINHLATILETLLPSCRLCIEQLQFPAIVIFHTISTILVFQHLLPRLSIQATNLTLSLNLWCWMD